MVLLISVTVQRGIIGVAMKFQSGEKNSKNLFGFIREGWKHWNRHLCYSSDLNVSPKLTIMKKLLLALIMCTAAFAALAQDPAPAATPAPAQDQPATDMQPIATSDLPAAITASLEGQDYTGWTVSNAYKKEKDGKTIYKVELSNGSATKMVKFDADGNKLKGKDKEKEKEVQ